jgi:hypothetical protein
MPRRLPLWCAPALLLALTVPALAQDPAASATDSLQFENNTAEINTAETNLAEKERALQAWARAAEPGPWHAFLAQRAGKWQVAGRIWNDPEGEPATSASTARLEMIMGDRFLQEVLKGTSGDQKFEGFGLLGCDNADSTVTSLWIDSMGTMTSILTGPAGQPGQPLELRGSMTDPATGRQMNLRVLLTFVSADEHRWDYYGAPEGFDEAKMMELIYTRR